MTAAGLTAVTTLDWANPHIYADGRLLWQAFDNLLSNITKCALAGTRVYLTTRAANGQVEVTFRIVSREALNISAEELMERFVRGDISRNTEGRGLTSPSPAASLSSTRASSPSPWTGTCSRPP